jgi:hypothetical protein
MRLTQYFVPISVAVSVLTGCHALSAGEQGRADTTASSNPHAEATPVSLAEATQIARDAYVYAYPLVLQDVTRIHTSNVSVAHFPYAPPNQLAHAPAFPPADMKVVVRPNADTLYSVGWLDLGPEPVVLSVPATDRYFMLPLLSLWSDVFAVPGTRTTGRNRAADFLVVGPHWQGRAPAGMEIIHAPTRYVGILGRTQTNGPADYAYVHTLQRNYRLTPLSAWGNPAAAPQRWTVDPDVDMKTPPPAVVDRMDARTFFRRFTSLLADNPPGPFDYPIIHRMERLGIQVGSVFHLDNTSPAMRSAFERGMEEGKALVAKQERKESGAGEKGWVYTTESGAYGVNYLYRAAIASCCLGENLADDALYPSASTDSEGKPFDGSRRYVWHVDKSQLPPVDAFWSITAYDARGYFIPNDLKRQTLGDRSKLNFNDDGSLDFYIQATSPGKDKEANWLPVAPGPFTLMLRLYSPKFAALDSDWRPPLVVRESGS